MMFSLVPKTKKGGIVGTDADALIASYGDAAYDEARTRGREERLAKVIDGNRPPGHWQKVRREIAKRTGKQIGADSGSRYPDS
jgi:hypothetical protein